jgi:hypothetical protein
MFMNPNSAAKNNAFLDSIGVKVNRERSTSPVAGQGRIITENEEKLRQAILENEALERLYNQKQVDLERINFKY